MAEHRTCPDNGTAGWVLVVPARVGRAGKSRLRSSLGPYTEAIAEAMALDTLDACQAVVGADRVVVVTPHPEWLRRLTWHPIVAVDPGTGLDAAVLAGCRVAASRWPGSSIAVLLGDHPALRPSELVHALRAASAHRRALVRDADGRGTALLTASSGRLPRPAFGAGSAARHLTRGHVELALDLPGLRIDVDDADALHAAFRMGVGRHTSAAVRTLPLAAMQASVHTFEEGHGSVLLDDGREVPFDEAAWSGSGLRHLRPGQRVSVTLAADDRAVTRLWIVGIGEGETIR